MKTITYEDGRGNQYKDKVPESCFENALESLNLMGYSLTGDGK